MKKELITGLVEKADSFLESTDIIFDVYDLSVVWMSEKNAKRWGYDSPCELVGKSVFELIGKNLVEVIRVIQKKLILRPNEVIEGDFVALYKNKETKKVKALSIFLNYEGSPYVATKVL